MDEITARPTATVAACGPYSPVWTHSSGGILYVGGASASSYYDALNVGAIVALVYTPMDSFYIQLKSTEEDAVERRLFVWHLDDTRTAERTNISAALDAMVQFAARFLTAGESVLVHCMAGMSRSAAAAWAIMIRLGVAPIDAALQLRAARPCICVNPFIARQVVAWAEGEPTPHHTVALENWSPDALANVNVTEGE